jgi:hypothetical protein
MISLLYPFLNAATYNVQTIVDKPTNANRSRIVRNIIELRKKAQIVGLQQIRLPPKDNCSLDRIAPNTKVYYNTYDPKEDSWREQKIADKEKKDKRDRDREGKSSSPKIARRDYARAGTAILLDKRVLEDYTVTHVIVVRGHIHYLQFDPKNSDKNVPFRHYNVYMYTGLSSVYKINTTFLKILIKSPPPHHCTFMGDWNFVIDPSDRSSGVSDTNHFRLAEVEQSAHTWF